MLSKKIILNYRLRKFIIESRKSTQKNINPLLTADYISEKIGRAKSWLSQVENGRLKSVKTNDLINVFCYLKDKDINLPNDRKQVAEYLDNEIMYIMITQKHGIINEDGSIPDFSEMLSFQQAREHIRFASINLCDTFYRLYQESIEDIQKNLKSNIKHINSSIVQWFNRAFNDTSELFSDEISTRNLYLLIETSINIYNGNYEYFGLNPLSITTEELQLLKNKLDTDYFVKSKTLIKSLNEYRENEFDKVVTHFSSEEYMTWKNKHVYIGNDPFPMVVNYLDTPHSDDNFVTYEDLNSAIGLSQEEYLYIIKQVYDQFDVCYKRCKTLLRDYQDLQDENDELFEENEQLKKELAILKSTD